MDVTNYILLPFNFKYLNETDVLLVNQAGEYQSVPINVFNDFCTQKLSLDNPFYRQLKAKHFLTVAKEKELALNMLAAKLRTRKSFITDFTGLHMIVITLRCNCFCKYCHASSADIHSNNYDMTWDIAKKTIDMIFQTPSKDIKIEFQGGEPLLNWDVLKETVLYAEFLNKFAKKKIGFVICTNLMQVSKEQLDFFYKHAIEISSSLDGTKVMHDENRHSMICESAYDEFIKNSQLVKQTLGTGGCSPLLTITKTNINRLREVIDEYIVNGFNAIFLRPLNLYGRAVQNKDFLGYSAEEFFSAYKDALEYIIALNKQGVPVSENYTTLFLSRILTPFSTGFVDLQSPSGAGISGAIYNYDGKIYPADEARMLAEMGDDYFCMGTIDDKYNSVFAGKIIRNIVKHSCVENMPVCSECVYQQYCGADIIRNYLETKDLMGNRLKSGFCNRNKMILDHIFSLLNSDDEDVMDIFWSWVTGRNYSEVKI